MSKTQEEEQIIAELLNYKLFANGYQVTTRKLCKVKHLKN